MGAFKEIASSIELKHYTKGSASFSRKYKDNWKVFFRGNLIGVMHRDDNDSIGGFLSNFTDTELFDYVCELIEEDLKERNKQ